MIFAIILLTILFSAFFSGYEIAFISANKLKIELGKSQQLLSARILSNFVKQPSHFIGTILVGNNIALVIYSIMMSRLIDHHIAELIHYSEKSFTVLILSTLISTHIILIFVEFIPKALFRLEPNAVLNFFAIPFQGIYWILSPIAVGFAYLSKLILRYLFGLKVEEKSRFLNEPT